MAEYLLLQPCPQLGRPSAKCCIFFTGWRRRFGYVEDNCFLRRKYTPSTSPLTINSYSSPWLMLSDSTGSENNCNKPRDKEEAAKPRMVHKFYSLAERKAITIEKKLSSSDPDPNDFVRVSSCYGWVGFIKRNRDFNFFMSNPLNGRSINLPSIKKLFIFGYNTFFFMERVVMSSPYPEAEDCRVLVRTTSLPRKYRDRNTTLAFCTPGSCDNKASTWTNLESPLNEYADIVYSAKDQRFYAMDQDFLMESWDLSDPSNPKRNPIVIGEDKIDAMWRCLGRSREPAISLVKDREYLRRYQLATKSYLVADPSLAGQVFLIHRHIACDVGRASSVVFRPLSKVPKGDYNVGGTTIVSTLPKKIDYCDQLPYKTLSLDVYKIDTTNDRRTTTLERMESLDDRAFFIGLNNGFVLSAKDFPELEHNSVYFTDDVPGSRAYDHYGGHDNGIYNYKDRSVKECCYPVDVNKFKKLKHSPLWFSPHF